jgi:hypothetical protein
VIAAGYKSASAHGGHWVLSWFGVLGLPQWSTRSTTQLVLTYPDRNEPDYSDFTSFEGEVEVGQCSPFRRKATGVSKSPALARASPAAASLRARVVGRSAWACVPARRLCASCAPVGARFQRFQAGSSGVFLA